MNCLIWREHDARKNAVSMAARAEFSHKQILNRSGAEMIAMMAARGVGFEDYPETFRRGRYFQKRTVMKRLADWELARIPAKHRPTGPVPRTKIQQMDWPPLARISNLIEVVFDGSEPILAPLRPR